MMRQINLTLILPHAIIFVLSIQNIKNSSMYLIRTGIIFSGDIHTLAKRWRNIIESQENTLMTQ